MTLEKNSFIIFEVTSKRLTYLTIIMDHEYNSLKDTFDSLNMRAQIKYTGSESWILDVYKSIRERCEHVEVDVYHTFPLYSVGVMHNIWTEMRKIIKEINRLWNEEN